MLRVGLTGSIATGKSFVSGELLKLGCHVIDADLLARKVVEPGSEGLRAVVETFGGGVLRKDGSLDRAKLAGEVFGDEQKRKALNAILHPLIFAEQDRWLRDRETEDPDGIGVVDAALLIESGGYKRFDKLIVVHCRPEIQLERVIKRDRLSSAEATKRISAQMTQGEKLKYADYAIDTSGSFEETRAQIQKVYEALRGVAANKG